MTVRDLWDACLIELNKVLAPPMLLSDFVYFANKAIQLYFNKKYNLFEINQQITDDLWMLAKSVELDVTKNSDLSLGRFTYDCELPSDYVHILNCTCVFERPTKCQECLKEFVPANKLESKAASQIYSNYYMRPSMKRPYYYFMNVKDSPNTNIGIPDSKKREYTRYGNNRTQILQIRCGDVEKTPLVKVLIDYLYAPERIVLTKEDLDKVEDTTALLEFPDYVANEIVRETVLLLLENFGDPRIQTNYLISNSIMAGATSSDK